MKRTTFRLTNRQKVKLIAIVIVIVFTVAGAIINEHHGGYLDNILNGENESSLNSVVIGEEISDPKFTYHFIDVGQGDGTLILSEKGSVLIDAGPGDHTLSTVEYIGTLTDTIDIMILTHPHEDHIGAAYEIINTVDVNTVIMPDASSNTATFTKLLDAIEKNGCNVIEAKAGDMYNSGEIQIELFGPVMKDDENLNNVSIFTKITTGEITAMFTGDAEKEAENELLKKYSKDQLDADIFQVGHHGSSTSNSIKLLKAVTPDIAVISCSDDNTYGHPHKETLDNLQEFGINVYRTDTMGSVVITTDGKNIGVSVSYT